MLKQHKVLRIKLYLSFSLSRLLSLRFYLYKLPHVDRGLLNGGQSYLLMDKGSEGWTDGNVLVNDSTGALGRTVGQLYEQGKVWFLLLLISDHI